ncbi:hypothetical protein M2451_003281 [Dysgonomonas sp. PFB1-18]|uniref:hypothetical protein n=1 Tax=unclassified Dysgonomonas TaxID=2630389 RepID=UPI002473AA8F|nr:MULTISPECIES: hypothetical protein [unclassified Dysgonomonas]MDL2303432.1 hypothetical protein [Dysgonomonas sp. OttesenSCG-928-D17]MDH6310394.1 hypothetical protein [Dysgonomonas sp. PF1-14]MDH6340276.1 hypothetical protein [Dysgonomonas sp. PF1-16]MDH6381944.1 hypothetical protein [Dysgonomonas sp. PFB1-18]MDH6399247.1 hypothetical protein [Dysgonomonas sp. PF1-23]
MIKKVLLTIICSASVLLFLSCGNRQENRDIEKHLSRINTNASFTLDTINTASWDSVYVLSPYMIPEYQDFNITMTDETDADISNSIGNSDHICILLFTKNNTLVNYATIKREIADFHSLKKYSSKQRYRINSRREVYIDSLQQVY